MIGDPQEGFDALAYDFLDAGDGEATRTRLLREHPAHALDLLYLAVTDPLDLDSEGAAPSSALLARLRDDARTVLLPAPSPALSSLLAQARAYAGLDARALARRLGLGVDVLAVLEERQIVGSSVPPFALRRIGAAIGASAEAVAAYLMKPAASGAAAYHAPHGHQVARPLLFGDALAQSVLTTKAQKESWLVDDTSSGATETPS